ncbi:MAG: six-cysteine ranthipeptide SCIFF [Clostridia bacterium]|nr:six-cysteine ranthipeptide SCIFF [Clostridia bacterium]
MKKTKRIKTIETRDLVKSVKNGGCGECQTSCGVANQQCEKK